MAIIVQKFGGSSLATPTARSAAIAKVLAAKQAGYTPVVVVSAMGRSGDPYATDTLQSLALGQAISRRDLDLVMCCGEIISAGVFVSLLQTAGERACLLTGWQAGIVTDEQHGDARIVDIQPEHILELLNDGQIVVVAGFQGMSEQGEITTLGRGGSDTTASALGVAVNAELVEIYTDVPGVFTADPRLVPDARIVPTLSYEAVLQLANAGAKVLHPRSVEIAMRRSLPLWVKPTSGDHPGTCIGPTRGYEGRQSLTVIGIAHRDNLAQISQELPEQPAHESSLLDTLCHAGVEVISANLNRRSQQFIFSVDQLTQAETAMAELDSSVSIRRGCARISVVGVAPLQRTVALLTLTQALASAKIEVLQTSDAPLTVSCLVDQAELTPALRTLHHVFGLA